MDVDAPQTAARRLLSADRWQTAAGIADLIRDALPEARALAAYDRLVASGVKAQKRKADRVQTGRVRLAQEALQRLVQRGEAEAVGAGSDRQFRLVSGGLMLPTAMSAPPKVKKEWVPLDRLTFDARLQMRVFPPGIVFHQEVVLELVDLLENGGTFDTLMCAVKEEVHNRDPIYWVYSGFHRGAAYRQWGKQGQVEMLIYPGTFADALFLSLSQNPFHGVKRSEPDKTRALETLIDTPEMFARVSSMVRKDGMGLYKALAQTCAVSEGFVGKVLKGRNLSAEGTKLVSRKPTFKPKLQTHSPVSTEVSELRISEREPEDDEFEEVTEDVSKSYTPSKNGTHRISGIPETLPQRLAVKVAELREQLELYAESVEGRWLLGTEFVSDDGVRVGSALGQHLAGGETEEEWESMADRSQRIHDAETRARLKEHQTDLPRGCADCSFLRELAAVLIQGKATGKDK